MACDKAKAQAEIKAAFELVDKDHSGYIDAAEVKNVLVQYYKSKGKPCDGTKIDSECAAFVKDLDTDSDNKVSLKEFTDFIMQLVCS